MTPTTDSRTITAVRHDKNTWETSVDHRQREPCGIRAARALAPAERTRTNDSESLRMPCRYPLRYSRKRVLKRASGSGFFGG